MAQRCASRSMAIFAAPAERSHGDRARDSNSKAWSPTSSNDGTLHDDLELPEISKSTLDRLRQVATSAVVILPSPLLRLWEDNSPSTDSKDFGSTNYLLGLRGMAQVSLYPKTCPIVNSIISILPSSMVQANGDSQLFLRLCRALRYALSWRSYTRIRPPDIHATSRSTPLLLWSCMGEDVLHSFRLRVICQADRNYIRERLGMPPSNDGFGILPPRL